MTSWGQFRKVWLRPEVYPLIGSMVVALGFCGSALLNKAFDPTVGWSKARRKGETVFMDGVEEVVPMWSNAKSSSIRIFSKENPVIDNKITYVEPPSSVTIPGVVSNDEPIEIDEVGAEVTLVKDPLVEELEENEVPLQADEAEEPPHPVQAEESFHPVEATMGVVDEAAETIHAAVDAAIHKAAEGIEKAESAAASVADSVTDSVASTVVSQETLAEAHLHEAKAAAIDAAEAAKPE